MQAVILAAGRGVRLKPITDEIPKCMAGIKDRPILEHIMEHLIDAGVNEINLVVGYKREIIEEHFGDEFYGTKLNYFVQQEPKGTAHALSLVEDNIKDMFILANSDVIVGKKNYSKIMESDEFEKADAVMLARKVEDPWRFGVLETNDKRQVTNIIEKPKPGEEPGNLVSTGIFRFKQDFFECVNETPISVRNEYELIDSLKNYMQKGKIVEYRFCEGTCIDIEGKEDLRKANEMDLEVFPK